MFEIVSQQKQYLTYSLTDTVAESEIDVVPERGGIILAWRIGGKDIFYLDKERFTNPELSIRGGNPILFPICGNLPDNVYRHNNKEYALKQHGFARNLPWEVAEEETKGDRAAITLALYSNDETLAAFPFEFQVSFTYQLAGNSIEIIQRYTNTGSEPMPFSTGFHPYFYASDKAQLQFQIPSSEYWDQKNHTTHSFTGSFDFELDEIDVAFGDLTAQSASVIDPSRQLELIVEYDDAYSYLVFWTLKGKDYYCLEPWSAPRNALNSGKNLMVLAPGESRETRVRYTAKFF